MVRTSAGRRGRAFRSRNEEWGEGGSAEAAARALEIGPGGEETPPGPANQFSLSYFQYFVPATSAFAISPFSVS